mgnify:CR=1 FL=1
MNTKNLKAYLSCGVEKHLNGTFTMFGYIDNKQGQEVASHKCIYQGYTLAEARAKFKTELVDILEMLEDEKIFTHDEWLIFDYPHKSINTRGGRK